MVTLQRKIFQRLVSGSWDSWFFIEWEDLTTQFTLCQTFSLYMFDTI